MILHSLKIDNFRIFNNLVIPKLGRVNLITGRNNTGKSSLLESLRILNEQARPSILKNITDSHDEFLQSAELNESGREAYQYFFNGRNYPEIDDKNIYIGDLTKDTYVEISHELINVVFERVKDEGGGESERVIRRRKIVKKLEASSEESYGQMLVIKTPGKTAHLEISDNELISGSHKFWDKINAIESTPVSWIPTRFLSSDILAAQWDLILFSQYSEDVKETLRIIDKDIEDLGFVKKNGKTDERYPLVKKKGSVQGIPLSSMGDGILRVLQFALGLYQAKGGMLLIDEFENGLHHTVQFQVWDKLFKLAEQLNVQVFATSHSNDSIHAFAKAAIKSHEQGVLINLAKSAMADSQGEIIASVYDESKLKSIVEMDIEVRV